MLASLAQHKVDHGSHVVRALPAPQELKFELDDTSKGFVARAEKDFDELVGKHELLVGILWPSKVQIVDGSYRLTSSRFCTMRDTERISSRSSRHLLMLGCSL